MEEEKPCKVDYHKRVQYFFECPECHRGSEIDNMYGDNAGMNIEKGLEVRCDNCGKTYELDDEVSD